MAIQTLVKQDFSLEGVRYLTGQVVTFEDDEEARWAQRNFFVSFAQAEITAAISAQAPQLRHSVSAYAPPADTMGSQFYSTVQAMLAAYEGQRTKDEMFGPRILARSGFPVAADVPAITGITGAPSGDADASAQMVYPFVTDLSSTDNLPALPKHFVRGFSQGLRKRGTFGTCFRLSGATAKYGQVGNQDLDSVLGYGIDSCVQTMDFILDGDVVFLKTLAGASNANVEFYVNGSLVTAAPGTGAVTDGFRGYTLSANGWFKLKFSTVARRRIQAVCPGQNVPGVLATRNTATITPAIESPLTWLMLGDSFSQYTGATTRTVGLAEWLHASFGYEFDVINAGSGGANFAGTNCIRPGDSLQVGLKGSIRSQWQHHAKVNAPQIVSMLIGHNDSDKDQTRCAYEVGALLDEIRRDAPQALVLLFASNASPSIIGNGTAVTVENTIMSVARGRPGVFAFPLQTWRAGPFLRGTGSAIGTNGTGNTDIYTGLAADTTHPNDAGHRAYGLMMASRIYAALRTL